MRPGNPDPDASLSEMPLFVLALVLVLLVPFRAWAEGAVPQPPCGVPPQPAYSKSDQAPATTVWTEASLRKIGWRPPSCLGWGSDRTRLVVALAGDFRFAGSLDELLGRLGAFSAYKSIRYWSVSHQRWQELVTEAGRVGGPDLTTADLTAGRTFDYFENGHAGRATYRMRVLERTPERVVLASENMTPIRVALLTAFEPGALQSVTFLEKRGPGVWGYYQMIRAGEGSSVIALGNDASYVNRLAALYRYVAGIPTDRDPPAT